MKLVQALFIIAAMGMTSAAHAWCSQPMQPITNDSFAINMYRQQMADYQQCVYQEQQQQQREMQRQLQQIRNNQRRGSFDSGLGSWGGSWNTW